MEPEPVVLEQLVERIVAAVRPLRIILFGSAARGELGPDSDLDVLVIMPDGSQRRRTAQDLHQHLHGLPVAVDIIVATPADLEQHKNTIGLIYRDALREGRDLYVA